MENEGIDEWGLLSAQDFNALARLVVSLTTLEGLTNVNTGSNVNDVVLFKAANSNTWTTRSLSQITVTVDSTPTPNSDNPVSSNGVYVRLSELLEQIEDLDASLENVAFIGDDDGSAPASSDPLNIYAQKTWVDLNYLPKRNMDSTPTDNSTNSVTSGGVKRYVDAKDTGYQKPASGIPMSDLSQEVQIKINSGGGGGSSIFTFYTTASAEDGVTTLDWGTTKYSDIESAINSYDSVQVKVDGSEIVLRYDSSISNDDGTQNFLFTSRWYFFREVFLTLIVMKGENDTINSTIKSGQFENADWNETDVENPSYIQNKPQIPKITTFYVAGTDTNGTVTYDWGTTTWNDLVNAIETSDIVRVSLMNGLFILQHGSSISENDGTAYTFFGITQLFQRAVASLTVMEGENGEILTSEDTWILRHSDWAEDDSSSSAYIANKPAIPYADINNGAAAKASAIPFGHVDSTSTATAFTATVEGITRLADGVCVLLENGVVTSAAGFTLDINNLGAKPVFNNLTAATRDTTIFNVNYTMLFIYDGNRVVDGITGAWCCYRGYDANTNTIGYQLRTNSSTLPVSDQTGRYRLLFTSADGKKLVPANTSTSTSATDTKAVNQRPIDPHGDIFYYSYTTVLAANANVGTAYQWQQYPFTLGYSFNRTNAALKLTHPSPIYIKCTPQTDGSAIIDADTPYVQSLPTTEDGKIYIYLGRAYSATAVELVTNHPVYEFKKGAIRQWVNAVTQSGGSGGSGGDENVIESITFNGANVPVDGNKNAAITANIPSELSELSEDSTHRVVTDTEKSTWNGKQAAISDLETIRSNAAAGAAKVSNVQSDWNATSGAAVILNKPTIPAAVTESTVSGWGFTKNSGTYSKPSGGIPSTDLATAVQNALTAAGTALQPADLNTLNGKVAALESLVSESANPTAAIDKFNEIVAFLANITNTDTLEGILSGLNEAIAAKYTKPSGGIPKGDLASAVQTSLGKADTALQSYTETDPTVPAWAKAATKPTYTPEEIGALPDTYTPPVLSVNGQTGAVNLIIPAAVTESTVSDWGFTKNTGTYSKPSGGIPKSDLADGVLPTKVSELTNDAGYVTDDSVVTIYSGNTTPSSSLGNNGDIYIQTS